MSWLSSLFSGGNPAADAANAQTAALEKQQAKHDAAVATGKKSIDNAFTQFDDNYFDHYGQAYRDTYNPQLDDQYGIAKDQITATLAGRDQLDSSVGANTLAQLGKTYNNAQVDIGNKSVDAENQFKGSVDNTKTNLYGMNASAADPYTTASEAKAASSAIVAPSSYPTMSNVFGDAISAYGTAAKANNQSMNPSSGGIFAPSQWFAPVPSP